jgi:hypothetical protein
MLEAIINGLSALRDLARAGVNSKDPVFRKASKEEHRFLAPIVEIITRPQYSIQKAAGYKQSEFAPATAVKNQELEARPKGFGGRILRVLAFNDRVAAGTSDLINALTNNALGSVGMVAGIIAGTLARLGIFVGLTAVEIAATLLLLGILIPVLIIASPILIPAYIAIKKSEKAGKEVNALKLENSQLKVQVQELKKENARMEKIMEENKLMDAFKQFSEFAKVPLIYNPSAGFDSIL